MSLSRWSYWSQVIVQRMTLALLLSIAAAGTPLEHRCDGRLSVLA